MKIDASMKFLKMLRNRIGPDLEYHLKLDTDGKFYVTVTCHTSKTRKFKDDTLYHRIEIAEYDMKKNDFILCNQINNIFENLITEVTQDDNIAS